MVKHTYIHTYRENIVEEIYFNYVQAYVTVRVSLWS